MAMRGQGGEGINGSEAKARGKCAGRSRASETSDKRIEDERMKTHSKLTNRALIHLFFINMIFVKLHDIN
jgi:hypothetical protein